VDPYLWGIEVKEGKKTYYWNISLKGEQKNDVETIGFAAVYLRRRHQENMVHGDVNPDNLVFTNFKMDAAVQNWKINTMLRYIPDDYDFEFPMIGERLWFGYEFLKNINLYWIRYVSKKLERLGWFRCKYRPYFNLIDPDLEAPIGSKKGMVNALHHNLKNSYWDASDDLIGLLNAMIIRQGFEVSELDEDFKYSCDLGSLKSLYEMILEYYNWDCILCLCDGCAEMVRNKRMMPILKHGYCTLSELLGCSMNQQIENQYQNNNNNTKNEITSKNQEALQQVLQQSFSPSSPTYKRLEEIMHNNKNKHLYKTLQ
jgi:hypothetical protein